MIFIQQNSSKICYFIIQMSYSFPTQEDDTLDLLRQFLPDIQTELRAEIQPRLRQEVQAIAAQEIDKIELQFQQEFKQALVDMSVKFNQIQAEKKSAANHQITTLSAELQQKNKAKLTAAHERLMLQKFDTEILNHPKMQLVAKQIEDETAELLLEKYYANKERKEKELKVRIESRSQRQRGQIDEAIRTEVTVKSGLSELREQLKSLRVEVASEKSKCNVRIRSLLNQTAGILKKVEEHERHNLDKIIAGLETEIEQVKARKLKTNKMEVLQEMSEFQNHMFCMPKKEIMQTFTNYGAKKEHQYIYQDISFDSSRMTESQQNQYDGEDEDVSDSEIPEPPEQTVSEQYQPRPQFQVPEAAAGPLLRFNFEEMIASEWQDDDFDRFVRHEGQKQNRSNNREKEAKSNFSILYQQHLQNLNSKGKNNGRVKLTQKAKQQLLQNWNPQRYKS